jgi:hypothetical protein
MSRMRVTRSFGYNAICDVCGFKFKASQLSKRWDGMMVCKHDYEVRHSLDFYTTKNDAHLLPWTRSDSVGIDVGPVYINNTSSIAGIAVAGNAIANSSS